MSSVIFGDFEWDSEIAELNLRNHGVSFEEGASVFLDLDYLIVPDATEADRFIAIGFSRLARILFVVHVERGVRIRIVSARRATRTEINTYERRKNDPG